MRTSGKRPPAAAVASHVLTRLDVYDWGAFGGRHSARIDLEGTAIIGPTGSGKTTLVDALMTLLVASPRYNLASTGGHESDRDLVSYVRGVSGAGNDSEGNEHISRPGAVVTAIAARFSDGDSVLHIGGVFWFEGSSSALADLKRRWLFCHGDALDIEDWLEAHRDNWARGLKELERSHAGVKVYETKQAYLARLRTHFEVGENAFALLNRAAGLKQLNSIDSVFRELVLDDRSAFDSAKAVVEEFDTLAGIRQELETARLQRDALLPIASGWQDYETQCSVVDDLDRLKAIVPVWFAQQAANGWRAHEAKLQLQVRDLDAAVADVLERLKGAQQRDSAAHAAYLEVGGADMQRLHDLVQAQQLLLASRSRSAADYQRKAIALGMDGSLSAAALSANQAMAGQMHNVHAAEFSAQNQLAWERGSARVALEQKHAELADALAGIRQRPGSNIPLQQQEFRRDLALHLGLSEEELPFAAELVEIKSEQGAWRGAIERALGGERLRLLVHHDHAGPALDWMNVRDNRLHVRMHEANPQQEGAEFLGDGFARKLNFKAHPLREALKRLLAGIDRHCVADAAALRQTPHAMTVQGLMSGRRSFFEKNDNSPLQRGWMTGFDNRDQIAELEAQLKQLQAQLILAREGEQQAQQQADALRSSLGLLDSLANVVFEDIDVPGAQAELMRQQAALEQLTAPESDLAAAEKRWRQTTATLKALREEEVRLRADIKDIERQLVEAGRRLVRLAERIGNGLDAEAEERASKRFADVAGLPFDELDEAERRHGEALQLRLDAAVAQRGKTEKRLIADMKDAQQLDTGALVEAGSDLQDVPDYLARLRVLDEEALPEKRSRFLRYLNQSSDQGVTQLLSDVDNEVSAIEERIADLDVTLERVDFQPGRYLRLEPQRVEHESLHSLRQARARLRSAQLMDDLGESHYHALSALVTLLREAVDRRKTLPALALLDPRHRLQFSVWVVERSTGKVIEKRTSSQGGSGGEKEIIASYVLTASLSYALCPPGAAKPLFATIVLDEAFSKSSQAVAARIIRALAEFGLHPLFVTPNKELRLLRDHTRSAVVVHSRKARATMTSLSWEELDAFAQARVQHRERRSENA